MTNRIQEIKEKVNKLSYYPSRGDVKLLLEKLEVAVGALEKISKNKTDDCVMYTMGCDCDEETIQALKEIRD